MVLETTPPSATAQPTATELSRVIPRGIIKIALAQTAPALGDLTRNLNRHQELIEQARGLGADLVVFPELSLTGYDLRDQVPELAVPPTSEPIGELLRSAGCLSLVVGFVERSPQNRFYNSAFFSTGGRILHIHRKVYLPTYGLFDERRYFAPGNRLGAFDTQKFGRVGVLICEDFWHLSSALIMQAEGVDLLICVSNSPARGVVGEKIDTNTTYDLLSKTYAQTSGAAVVFVNRVGYDDGLCFWGGSQLVGPGGRTLVQAPLFEESLTLAQFDLGDLRRERILTPLGRDEELLLVLEELQRIKRARFGG